MTTDNGETVAHLFYTRQSSAGVWLAYEAQPTEGIAAEAIPMTTGATAYGAIAALCERLEYEERKRDVCATTGGKG